MNNATHANSTTNPTGAVDGSSHNTNHAISAGAAFRRRVTRTLKQGGTFAIFDVAGDMFEEPGNTEGLYHRDTRILSRFEMLLNGVRPLLLSSMTQDDNAVFSADLSNPDLSENGEIILRREQLHLNRTKYLWKASCYERVQIRNYSHQSQRIYLSFLFAADFADLFEVRGEHREARGHSVTTVEADYEVSLRYVGLDRVERLTHVTFDPPPLTLTGTRADYEIVLKPKEKTRIVISYGAREEDVRLALNGGSYLRHLRTARRELHKSSGNATAIQSSNAVFDEVARRSVSDLYMLISETPQGHYPAAGVPWFVTPFGRDGIITALMTLWLDPSIAKGVLGFLAKHQATAIEPERDAEPGKILHEMRLGEMANLREVPFGQYYGSVDATPLFVLLLGEYYERTGDLSFVRTLWPHVEAALRWIDTYGDRDGDGFVEYYRQTDTGLANQGWKDSYDSVFHADGRLAEGPIALCEVQAYVYGAKHHASVIARALGLYDQSSELLAQAQALRQKFEDNFWCDELSVYALALDGAKQPCRVVASNCGHVLYTGLASPERAERIAQRLLSPDMFSGWGVRTVASSEARYNPMSYHNGSVWPHDNGLIAAGLARYGDKQRAAQLFAAMFDSASYMELRRFPELFCGFVRRQRNGPTQYPVACAPHAWATASFVCMLQATLGLKICASSREVTFRQPFLPEFLDELHLRNLRLDTASVDVVLHRYGSDVAATVTRREGNLAVVVRP